MRDTDFSAHWVQGALKMNKSAGYDVWPLMRPHGQPWISSQPTFTHLLIKTWNGHGIKTRDDTLRSDLFMFWRPFPKHTTQIQILQLRRLLGPDLQWRCTWCGSRGLPALRRWWTWSTWNAPSTWPGPGSFPRRSGRWVARTQMARHGFRCDRSGTRMKARCSSSYQKPAESFVEGELWCTRIERKQEWQAMKRIQLIQVNHAFGGQGKQLDGVLIESWFTYKLI